MKEEENFARSKFQPTEMLVIVLCTLVLSQFAERMAMRPSI
ncbi:hypothetical protein HU200_026638 [Digitaria exilis]|uniref:Uncharacterized protein n=1 Tax=Digitaria exilis TaxID=1010633 RepID=A0A835BX11_9POAL|nr:hypothetical protein HU200_026638 [Digitaria exilis]